MSKASNTALTTSDVAVTPNQDSQKRLRPTLFLCRLVTALLYGGWGYGMIVRPAINADQLGHYYFIPGLPNGFVMLLGAVQIFIAAAVLLGYQKKITRGVLLALALLGVFMPRFLTGYWTGTFGQSTHPHLLTFTGFCLLGAAAMIYIMRNEDTLWSMADKDSASPAELSAGVAAKLSAPLLVTRFGIIMVFLAWTYDKIFNVTHGFRMFELYYKIPVTEGMVQGVGLLELVFLIVVALGLLKRLSRGALVLFSVYTAFIPLLLSGYVDFFNPSYAEVHARTGSFDPFFYLQTLAMPVAAIVIYALRDYDTLFSFSKKDRT